MLQFPRFRFSALNNQKTSRKAFFQNFRNALALGLAALLFSMPLGFTVSAQQPIRPGKTSLSTNGIDYFMLYQNEAGDTVCRAATPAERRALGTLDTSNLGLHPITHVGRESISSPDSMNAQGDTIVAANLTIILRATSQLDSFPDAKAAFVRAAQSWELIVKSPITIYIDADYGTTNFGQTWPTDVLGSTSSPSISRPYQSVRSSLISSASNSAENSLYNSLPSTSLPTDSGDKPNITVSSSIARAIGLLSATALDTDTSARIGFNSNFQYDFNRADGIASGKTDFESVAAHEIGHALGFTSRAGGGGSITPAIWDMFRFRTGTTLGTFGTAQRVTAADGSQYYFSGPAEQALSTGGPSGDATGGDGNQSSHWKQAVLNGGTYIGIMDPRIPSGRSRLITANDITALNAFGYNLENSAPPPPPPPPPAAPANDNFVNATTINGCSGSIPGTNISATKESGERNHGASAGGASVWYKWQAPSNGNVTITTAGSDFDTLLGVYTGNSVNGLAFIADNDDVVLAQIRTSTVTFNAIAGTTYRIAVDGYSDPGFDVDTGNIVLNWNHSNCTTTPSNPIDGSQFFVGQHYQDFLGRQADAGGLQYWSEQISGNSSNAPAPCPAGDAVCVHIRRINVSAAFFVENEFQRTGGFVVRFYKASYGTRPTFQQFTSDRGQVFEGDGLEARKQTFAANWVQRPEFLGKYPASLSGPAFVDAIVLNVVQNSNVDLSGQRANLIADFNAGGRAQVVRSMADNAAFSQAEYNAAFVLMQYFGYLQRTPDDDGYQFWLGILNNKAPNNFRAMVCAFLTSAEYQQRFGSTITRTNNDCANVGP
jgi:hypothetical protein